MVMRGEFPSQPRPGALHLPRRVHRVREISVACSLSSLILNGAPCLIAKPICQPMWHPTHQAQAARLLLSGNACWIIFSPPPPPKKMWRYARLNPNARLWHCRDHFGLLPNVLYWSLFSMQFNGSAQCRFRAEHIRQITWAQRPALRDRCR